MGYIGDMEHQGASARHMDIYRVQPRDAPNTSRVPWDFGLLLLVSILRSPGTMGLGVVAWSLGSRSNASLVPGARESLISIRLVLLTPLALLQGGRLVVSIKQAARTPWNGRMRFSWDGIGVPKCQQHMEAVFIVVSSYPADSSVTTAERRMVRATSASRSESLPVPSRWARPNRSWLVASGTERLTLCWVRVQPIPEYGSLVFVLHFRIPSIVRVFANPRV